MTIFKTLLLATAVGFAGIASGAQAETYVTTSHYATNGNNVLVSNPDVVILPGRAIGGRTVASKSMIAVGTRKVGLVGSRPYPIVASHIENTTVHDTPMGLVERTEVTNSGGVINVNSGGDYYTDSNGSYYADPAFNVRVHSSGGYND